MDIQISFDKKNAFGNSEILNFTFSGGFENLKQVDENDFVYVSSYNPTRELAYDFSYEKFVEVAYSKN